MSANVSCVAIATWQPTSCKRCPRPTYGATSPREPTPTINTRIELSLAIDTILQLGQRHPLVLAADCGTRAHPPGPCVATTPARGFLTRAAHQLIDDWPATQALA
jgi:hypothetical protein